MSPLVRPWHEAHWSPDHALVASATLPAATCSAESSSAGSSSSVELPTAAANAQGLLLQRPAARQRPCAQFRPYLLQPPCTTRLQSTLHQKIRPLPDGCCEHLL